MTAASQYTGPARADRGPGIAARPGRETVPQRAESGALLRDGALQGSRIGGYHRRVAGKTERREALKALLDEARGCEKCPQLASSRQTVVFGAGNADADLMFVGEAPGANEDRQGLPFVGQAGKLLDKLLGDIGLARSDVFVANVLMCRPPGNRDPQPTEIENCQEYLMRKIELIEPRVICTLGNFATKLLRGEPAGITRVHGEPEVQVLGARAVRLYPLFHPAAALYTPATLQTLQEDFGRIPELLALEAPEQPGPLEVPELPGEPVVRAAGAAPEPPSAPNGSAPQGAAPAPAAPAPAAAPPDPQLGLF